MAAIPMEMPSDLLWYRRSVYFAIHLWNYFAIALFRYSGFVGAVYSITLFYLYIFTIKAEAQARIIQDFSLIHRLTSSDKLTPFSAQNKASGGLSVSADGSNLKYGHDSE